VGEPTVHLAADPYILIWINLTVKPKLMPFSTVNLHKKFVHIKAHILRNYSSLATFLSLMVEVYLRANFLMVSVKRFFLQECISAPFKVIQGR